MDFSVFGGFMEFSSSKKEDISQYNKIQRLMRRSI
jgi:hypothetical protein